MSLEWTVARLGGQYKELWKESTITITYQNGAFIQPLGKWKRIGHIKQTELLSPQTVIFYVRESTVRRIYTCKKVVIGKRYNTAYIRQTQVEHTPE